MSEMQFKNHHKQSQWLTPDALQGMLRGIERESLRMQANGFLSQQPHPHALGSALTHPHITTDYSEALLEFITKPQQNIAQALQELTNIHCFVDENLPEGESLWPLSMPCMLDTDEQSIPLANYGTSNLGKFKTLYRHGLGIRYGRRMQTISGVHYNVSFPDHLFQRLQEQETDKKLKKLSLQDYRSHRYFALIRNFIRFIPMVIYLLGASPTICRCFVSGRKHILQDLGHGTLYLPYATALRMGPLGYQNTAQRQLGIHYNDLNGYLKGMKKAIHTVFEPFQALGLDDSESHPIQINDHILQIENEYYSLIRPKQSPMNGETPSQALENRGVAYVELRAVDVNPFTPIGITKESAAFLETLALYCLLLDSPSISPTEQYLIDKNQENVVHYGRSPHCQIKIMTPDRMEQFLLRDWVAHHLNQMKKYTQDLDQANNDSIYSRSWEVMQQRCIHVEQTLSAQILAQNKQGTAKFGASLAQQHQKFYQQHRLDKTLKAQFIDEVEVSLAQQQQLEQQQQISFKEYLKPYRKV